MMAAEQIKRKEMDANMNANEKIYVKFYTAYTTEDVFERGEIGLTSYAWSSIDNPIIGRFDTIEDALKAVCEANCFDYVPANCLNLGKGIPEEVGRFDISVMVNEDNCEATRSEIEEWKQGRKRLWNCQLSVHLGVCAERDLTPEEVSA